ncbi:hypothetical protein ACJMK2_023023 [Sinanodonta woodiana]|uniref:Ras-associating domain-containing protein n=1 Tax=Sinanodonta woodiana TaxID=1069815 RepID=A0ABD3T2W7_SINWO
MQMICILVEGRKCYLKVTKTATCDDVIQYLLNYNGLKENDKDPYYLIVSNNITEQQLPRKSSILNVANDLMSESNKIHFIMRKKTPIFKSKLSIAKRRRLREKPSTTDQKVVNDPSTDPSTPLDTSKYTSVRKFSEQIRVVKRLYELVRMQKKRLSEVYQKCNDTAKFFKQTITKKKIQPNADTSLDQFLQNVNKENMQGFLNFCEVVATKKMENLSSDLLISTSVNRSVIERHVRTISNTLQSPLVDNTTENPLVKETSVPKLNHDSDDLTNDVLISDDNIYQRAKGKNSFGRMALPSSRRLSIADPSRIRWNEEPLHSTPLANKTMSCLNKSLKPNRMERQFGSSRLSLDLLTNRTAQEMPKCDSSLHRRPDGDLSMFIFQRKSAFSSQTDKYKYFLENCNGSDSKDSLDRTLQDKELDDSVLNHIDDKMNVSVDSSPSFNILSRKVANDRDHLMLTVDRSPREFPPVHDVQEEYLDDLMKANFKMRLVNYSFSDVDISTLSCESVGMSCDCKKTPCATFTRDYVTRFGYSPESE